MNDDMNMMILIYQEQQNGVDKILIQAKILLATD